MEKDDSSQADRQPEVNPLEYIRDITNQTSWSSLAMEIYARSGESVAAETLRVAAKEGLMGFRKLRLTLGQFKALSDMTGLGFDELLVLAYPEQQKTRQPDELN